MGRRKRIVLAMLAYASFAAAAQAADQIRAGTPEPTAFVFSILDVGIDSGIFKKYGLDVERIDFAGGAKLHQAMTAGALDVVVGTGSDMLFLIRGAPEKGVAAWGNDLNSVSIVARNDDTVRTVDDLKGKMIGTTTAGSFTSWIARQVAVNHGWGPDGVKLAYLGQQSGLLAGLRAKNVDAIVGTTSSALVLEKQGQARIVAKAGDEVKDFIADVIYASDAMMRDHPDQLRRFLAAWFDTVKFVHANKAETIRITQKDTKLPDDVASEVYDAEAPNYFTDGHFDRKSFAVVKQSLMDVGLVSKMPPDDRLFTEQYLPSQ